VRVLGQPVEKWAQAMNGTVLTNIPVRLLASQPMIKFTVVRLDF